MKKIIDNSGRLCIPRDLREKCGLNPGAAYDLIECEGYLKVTPSKEVYTITLEEMKTLRKLYLMLSKSGFIDSYYDSVLSDITKRSDVKCENCGSPMFVTKDNTYKCFECGD